MKRSFFQLVFKPASILALACVMGEAGVPPASATGPALNAGTWLEYAVAHRLYNVPTVVPPAASWEGLFTRAR